jgi:hypothetical protein
MEFCYCWTVYTSEQNFNIYIEAIWKQRAKEIFWPKRDEGTGKCKTS